jgi:hypothetical protein
LHNSETEARPIGGLFTLAIINPGGEPRSMKIGTIASPWR